MDDNDERIERLVRSGVDINGRDNDGNTALHISVGYKCYGNIRTLIRLGAQLNIRNKRGFTAYDIAQIQKIELYYLDCCLEYGVCLNETYDAIEFARCDTMNRFKRLTQQGGEYMAANKSKQQGLYLLDEFEEAHKLWATVLYCEPNPEVQTIYRNFIEARKNLEEYIKNATPTTRRSGQTGN